MHAWEYQCPRTFCGHGRSDTGDRRHSSSNVFNALDTRSADCGTPIVAHRPHQIGRKYFFANIINIACRGRESESAACSFAGCAHLIGIEIAESIAHRYFALERCIKAETIIGCGDTNRCKLGCTVEGNIAFINSLGALVILETSLQYRVTTQKFCFARNNKLCGICLGRIDCIEHAEACKRLGEAIDICNLRTRLITGRAAQLDCVEQR